MDDRRHPVEAALGRVGRALLGLAALALEGVQQDGLLAQVVGALDEPDGDRDVVSGAEHVDADEARVAAAPMADSSRRIASVAPARTAMIASLARMAKAAMTAPSMTTYGSRSSRKRSVRVAGSAP